jgi:hypothetical protein
MNLYEIRRSDFNPIAITIFIVLIGLGILLFVTKFINEITLIVWSIFSILLSCSFKIADQWEKAVVLRMGKFIGMRGPGLFFIIPIIDRVASYTDQRIRTMIFPPSRVPRVKPLI